MMSLNRMEKEGIDMINLSHIRMMYESKSQKLLVLDDINLDIKKGRFISIIGPSGSGKTTLLNCMGGLLKPSKGVVKIDGQDLSQLSEEELTIFRRRKIGFVFQQFNLLPMLSVRENITLPVDIDGRKLDESYMLELIKILQIEDKLDSPIDELSGGQQQRVAIARALITKPSVVFADEPTGNLDSKTSLDVILLFRRLSDLYHQTIVMITHDEKIEYLTDQTFQIDDGRLVGGRRV